MKCCAYQSHLILYILYKISVVTNYYEINPDQPTKVSPLTLQNSVGFWHEASKTTLGLSIILHFA